MYSTLVLESHLFLKFTDLLCMQDTVAWHAVMLSKPVYIVAIMHIQYIQVLDNVNLNGLGLQEIPHLQGFVTT